jgi:hypothetical protein
MLGCIVLTWLYLPETKGRTPAELDAMFEARVPARKFKGKIILPLENESEKYDILTSFHSSRLCMQSQHGKLPC